MGDNTSSAVAQALIGYANTAADINGALNNEATRLWSALNSFAATCTEYSTGVGPELAGELRAYVGRTAPTDAWVRQVGQDFARADGGPLMNALAMFFGAKPRPGGGARPGGKGEAPETGWWPFKWEKPGSEDVDWEDRPLGGSQETKTTEKQVQVRGGFGRDEDGFLAGLDASAVSNKWERTDVFGNKWFGLTGTIGAQGPYAGGFVGAKGGSDPAVGASGGAGLGAIEAGTGLNFLGGNATIKLELGLKFDVGAELGRESKLKAGPLGLSLELGGAKDFHKSQ